MSFGIIVEICRADGLKRTLTMQPPHPYARIHSLADPNVCFTTRVKSKTTKPVWDEKFTFVIKDGESLEINVWDKTHEKVLKKYFVKSDRFLGSARITPKLIEKFTGYGEFILNLEQPSKSASRTSGHLIVKINQDPSFPPPRVETTPRPSTTLRKVASRTSSRIFIVEKVSEDQLSQLSSLGPNVRPRIGTLGSMSSIVSNSDNEGLQIKSTQNDSQPVFSPSKLPELNPTGDKDKTDLKPLINVERWVDSTFSGLETDDKNVPTTNAEKRSNHQRSLSVNDESSEKLEIPEVYQTLPNNLSINSKPNVTDLAANSDSPPSPSIIISEDSPSNSVTKEVKKSFSSLRVPVFKEGKSKEKLKKLNSYHGSGASISSSDMGHNSSNAGSLTSNSSLVKSTESIYEGFNKEELNKLAEKCKKFNYDLLNYGEKVTIFKLSMPRENVVEDSYCFLTNLKSAQTRTQFLIKFSDEEGVDYGGVGKEWFHILSSEVFKPDYGLFVVNQQSNQLDISVFSVNIVPEYKTYYKFIGQMLGLALYNSYHVDVSLNNLIFKHLLNEPVDLEDLKFYDYVMYNSLKWISENDVNTADLMYSFVAEYSLIDQPVIVDLIQNGRNIDVADDNKHDFIKKYVEWRLDKSIRPQMDSIIEGFYQIIPKELINIFNSNDLQLIICGLDTIEVSKWKANTVYRNCTQFTKQVIWFWRAVESLDNDRRRKLLQLVTGSSRLPIKEFGDFGVENSVPFTISLLTPFKNTNSLPIINTCFNRIGLPCYETYEKLFTKLRLTIDETREFSVQ